MRYIFNINRFLISEIRSKRLNKKQKIKECKRALQNNSWQRKCHGKECKKIYEKFDNGVKYLRLVIKYEGMQFEIAPQWCEIKEG